MDKIVNNKNYFLQTIIFLAIYTIAMALVEATVVIYLRELYYPSGFFIQSLQDLTAIPRHILKIEIWREASTIIMLIAVGFLTFRHIQAKFWAFILAFSLWDLFYYLFLYIFLH